MHKHNDRFPVGFFSRITPVLVVALLVSALTACEQNRGIRPPQASGNGAEIELAKRNAAAKVFSESVSQWGTAAKPAEENTGMLRLVPGDANFAGLGKSDGCRLNDEGARGPVLKLQLTVGENAQSVVVIESTDAKSAELARVSTEKASELGSMPAKMTWKKDGQDYADGDCSISARAASLKGGRTGYVFNIECKDAATIAKPQSGPASPTATRIHAAELQGTFFCTLRTRVR